MPANRRWDAKRDAAEPDIVKALEAAGCTVWRELVVDLIVRVHTDPPGVLRMMEVKTPTPSGKLPRDKRREAQEAFIAATGTPVVGTPEQALSALRIAFDETGT